MDNINDVNEKIKPFKTSDFDKDQMYEILLGLKQGLDVSAYADPKYNDNQMRAIREGLEKGLDVSVYADSKFDGAQMREIRFGLEDGVDITKYADPKFDISQMHKIRRGLEDELINEKIKPYKVSDFDDYQMFEIREGLEERLDISKYADPKYNVNQMRDIRFELVQGLNASKYAKLDLTEKLDLITWQIQKSSLSNLEKGIAEEIVFHISDNIDNNYIKEDKLDVNYEKIIEATNNILNIDYLWDDINQEIQNEVDNMGIEPESEGEEEDER